MREAQERIQTVKILLDLQYNVITSCNCCRGILEGLGMEMVEMPKRSKKKRSKAEKAGLAYGRSIKADALLMDRGDEYLAEVNRMMRPIALARIRLAEEKRVENRQKRIEKKEAQANG